MIDGLWTVKFASNAGSGGGVVVVNNGTILGGDSGFTYVGSSSSSNGRLSVRVKVDSFMPGVISVFPGLEHFTLALAGQDHPAEIQFAGNIEGIPNSDFKAVATKHSGT